jgi:hypothetical protein
MKAALPKCVLSLMCSTRQENIPSMAFISEPEKLQSEQSRGGEGVRRVCRVGHMTGRSVTDLCSVSRGELQGLHSADPALALMQRSISLQGLLRSAVNPSQHFEPLQKGRDPDFISHQDTVHACQMFRLQACSVPFCGTVVLPVHLPVQQAEGTPGTDGWFTGLLTSPMPGAYYAGTGSWVL